MTIPMRFVLAAVMLFPVFAGSSISLAQTTQAQNAALARQALRIDQLETEIRRLTGQNEGLIHRVDQLERKLKDLQAAVDGMAKPAAPAEQPSALTEPVPPAATAGANTAAAPPPSGSDKIPGADKGAKPLGLLKADSEKQTAAAPPMSPENLYEKAQNLIVRDRNFGEAQTLLQQFVDKNPNHALAPNAYYWLGRTHYVRNDFKNAAFAFAEGFQKFPKSEKAPANLLNLGMALSRLGKKKEACTTWAQLGKSYPRAPAAVKRRVDRERRRSKCS